MGVIPMYICYIKKETNNLFTQQKMSNTRSFRVTGNIAGLYTPPGSTTLTKLIPDIEVQLWHKAPMEIIFLGKGFTDASGNFLVDFTVESPAPYLQDGKIQNVFIKTFYKGEALN